MSSSSYQRVEHTDFTREQSEMFKDHIWDIWSLLEPSSDDHLLLSNARRALKEVEPELHGFLADIVDRILTPAGKSSLTWPEFTKILTPFIELRVSRDGKHSEIALLSASPVSEEEEVTASPEEPPDSKALERLENKHKFNSGDGRHHRHLPSPSVEKGAQGKKIAKAEKWNLVDPKLKNRPKWDNSVTRSGLKDGPYRGYSPPQRSIPPPSQLPGDGRVQEPRPPFGKLNSKTGEKTLAQKEEEAFRKKWANQQALPMEEIMRIQEGFEERMREREAKKLQRLADLSAALRSPEERECTFNPAIIREAPAYLLDAPRPQRPRFQAEPSLPIDANDREPACGEGLEWFEQKLFEESLRSDNPRNLQKDRVSEFIARPPPVSRKPIRSLIASADSKPLVYQNYYQRHCCAAMPRGECLGELQICTCDMCHCYDRTAGREAPAERPVKADIPEGEEVLHQKLSMHSNEAPGMLRKTNDKEPWCNTKYDWQDGLRGGYAPAYFRLQDDESRIHRRGYIG